ncbi:MAG: restriction endonuclease [Candidatus Hodarchaeota archaeon]
MKNNLEILALEELTLEYCQQRGLVVERSIHHLGDNRVDLIIQNGDGNEGIGVIIKDWKRAVGVDIIIRSEQIMKASRSITKMLIVSNFFSDPARSLAEKIGIFLFTRSDLLRILSSDMKTKSIKEIAENRQDIMLY